MNENIPIPIGGWQDLTESNAFNPEDERYNNHTDDTTEEERRKRQERGRRENESGDESGGSGSSSRQQNETFGGRTGTYTQEQSSKIYRQHNALDDFSIGEIRRIIDSSDINQTDVVRSGRTIVKIADASGIEAVVRYNEMSKAMARMQNAATTEGGQMLAACAAILKKDRLPKKGFSPDAKGLDDFRTTVDKIIFDETGIDVVGMSDKELKDLIRSNKLSSIQMQYGGNAQTLAEASLLVRKQAGMANSYRRAQAKRNSAIESLANRLMGNDVDLWEGSQYALRTYRSTKRILKTLKRIKNAMFQTTHQARSAASNVSAKATKATPRRRLIEPAKVETPKLEASRRQLTKSSRARTNFSKKITQKLSRYRNTLTGSTATGTTIGGTTASGAAAGGTGAAAGSTGAASGIGAVAGAVVIVVILVLMIVFILLLSVILNLSAFHSDVDNSLESPADVQTTDSMLYKVYQDLIALDEQYLNNVNRTNYTKQEVLDLAVNADVYNNYEVNEHYNPLSKKQGIDIDALGVVKSFDGLGNVIPLGRTNAKDILCMATVLVENSAESRPNTFKRYAKELWFDSHDFSVEFVTNSDGSLLVEPCDDGCSATYHVELEHYTVSTTDENGNPVTQHKTRTWFVGDDGTRVNYKNVWWNINRLIEEEHLFVFYDAQSETYRFCNGHAKYRSVSKVSYINDNINDKNQSSLFSADKFSKDPATADFWNGRGEFSRWYNFANIYQKQFTDFYKTPVEWNGERVKTFEAWVGQKVIDSITGNDECEDENAKKSEEYIEWEGWTDGCKDWAHTLFEQDWYDLYGIHFDTLELSEINQLVKDVDDETMQNLLKFALGNVGHIPYYWGGKQNVTGYEIYKDQVDTSPQDFLAKYYPHLGKRFVEVKSGKVKSVNGWYACDGEDTKRTIIGLDCSGWVCFVYNNMGIPLDGGTASLKTAGIGVNFLDLKPGDLMIDDPDNAHVVMFLRWDNADKSSYSTVECSGSSGVILKEGVKKQWDYYRRIVD